MEKTQEIREFPKKNSMNTNHGNESLLKCSAVRFVKGCISGFLAASIL
jgi:hypothetical protein